MSSRSSAIFERCNMMHFGSYVIDLGEGCHDNVLVGNRIIDGGSGGVKVGVVDRNAQPPIVPTGNKIANLGEIKNRINLIETGR